MTHDGAESMSRLAVRGSIYRAGASSVTLGLGLLRAVLLARLLMPEDFGVAALALFFVQISGQLRGLGIGSALVQRPVVDDRVLSTYVTLHLSLLLSSIALIAAIAPFLVGMYPEMPNLGVVLFAFLAVELVRGLNGIPESLLARNLAFGSLALVDAVSAVTMTVVAPALAWYGAGVFSLVAEQASGMAARFALLFFVLLPFRPRIGWDRDVARWFWRYGRSVWTASKLRFVTERFDDFWVGTALGGAALGIYSRAYEFAQYPRRVLANPVLAVFFPVFARLQHDRTELSRAFFRVMALIVRAGFGLSLVLIASAPELVRLLLGDRWISMTLPFQLMVVYTLLDPLKLAIESLLSAVGHPEVHVRVGLVQVIFFVPAVILSSRWQGVIGVALAADAMVALGALLLFRACRRVVDFSSRALWLWPSVAALAAAGAALGLLPRLASESLWTSLLLKAGLVASVYGCVLFAVERAGLSEAFRLVRDVVRPSPPPETSAGTREREGGP